MAQLHVLEKLYDLSGSKKIVFPFKGRATAQVAYFSQFPIDVKAEASSFYSNLGLSQSDIAVRLAQLRPRPVYVTRGKGGNVGLVVGPSGATDSVLLNTQWFRTWMRRGGTPALAEVRMDHLTTSTTYLMSQDELLWHFGEKAVRGPTYTPGTGGQPPTSLVAGQWRPFIELQERCLSWQVLDRYGGLQETLLLPALGSVQPGYTPFVKNGSWNRGYTFSLETAIDPSPELNNEIAEWCMGSDFVANGGEGLFGYLEPAETPPVQVDFLLRPTPGFFSGLSKDVLTATWDSARDLLSLGEKALEMGSVFPFPIVSKLVGYIVGLAHETQLTYIEVPSWAHTESSTAMNVPYAFIDITGAQYKKLYPVSSLPIEAQADVSVKMAELPDDMLFRVAFARSGFQYATVAYDETQLARDALRSGASLAEILFDDLADDKPARDYASLGALSTVAISKGKNRYVALPLTSADSDFVSALPIVFSRVSGVVTAAQDGYEIDSGQAHVAIASGANFSFTAPLTADETAMEFFTLPSWTAVIEIIEEGSESGKYLIDESRNTDDLRFTTSDDAIARSLPLLLGFSAEDFGATAFAGALGATPPVIVSEAERGVAT